jgi:glyoxylate/hydroxypyruvate reductase A
MTQQTKGLLNARLFARMRPGGALINMGRGGQQVEDDILAALDSGQLSHAVLDVFQTEPLPQGHPFWTHPRVTVTPHNAAITQPGTAARVVGDAIRAVLEGREPANVVDPGAGY